MVEDAQLQQAGYPFTGHFLDLNGLKYHYLDEGQGEAVVMLHGNPSWSFYYRNLVRELRSTHRVIVPDHIGCGLSDKPADSSIPIGWNSGLRISMRCSTALICRPN